MNAPFTHRCIPFVVDGKAHAFVHMYLHVAPNGLATMSGRVVWTDLIVQRALEAGVQETQCLGAMLIAREMLGFGHQNCPMTEQQARDVVTGYFRGEGLLCDKSMVDEVIEGLDFASSPNPHVFTPIRVG
jgi:hypothetical protein